MNFKNLILKSGIRPIFFQHSFHLFEHWTRFMSQNPSHLETRVLQGHNRAKQTVIGQFYQPGLKLDGLE